MAGKGRYRPIADAHGRTAAGVCGNPSQMAMDPNTMKNPHVRNRRRSKDLDLREIALFNHAD